MNITRMNRQYALAAERGNALVIVMMLCLVSLILIGSYLQTISRQSKINYRGTLLNEARNAAEGMAEYAASELYRRAQADPSFGSTNNPLAGYTLPPSDLTFIAPDTGINHVLVSGVQFQNSLISPAPSGPMLIDPTDPVNAVDPDAGKILNVRSVNIFGKASAQDPVTNAIVTSYVAENVSIREQAWFNYAIFYNMDMEFHAGPNFTVLGPVFTNASAYLTEGAGNSLQFYATLAAYQQLLRYDKYNGDSTTAGHTGTDRKSTRLNSSHHAISRMPSSA